MFIRGSLNRAYFVYNLMYEIIMMVEFKAKWENNLNEIWGKNVFKR